MQGKLIVIEGLDGSGKATQSEKLYEYLKEKGKKVIKVSFPDYESPSSSLVRMYLSGDFGTDPDSVNPYASSSFYACDRFASYKTKWSSEYNSGAVIIADRYTTSNAVHQCAKLPEKEWDKFLKWLFDYEYNLLGIPSPDNVIYLRVDTEISRKLMNHRYNNDETKKDIHEKNTDYLKRSRLSADYCAETLGWKTIECTADGKMRTVDEIFYDILSAIGI
ncbi:MAG: deoxynucleoside kinase [Ruminococcus sp.]|nr:deoxynucleoside kinase [Ruminococcus sp.]